MKLTDLFGIVGVVCIALFAFAVWPPLALVVVGAVALLVSWMNR